MDATSHAQKVHVDAEIMHTETLMTHKLFYEGLQQAALQLAQEIHNSLICNTRWKLAHIETFMTHKLFYERLQQVAL